MSRTSQEVWKAISQEARDLIENQIVDAWYAGDEIPQRFADHWFAGARTMFEYQATEKDCRCPDATGRGLCYKCKKLNLTFVKKA